MSWVKLDDGFADHPKIIALTPQARDLFIWGLCYCARQLTDGFVGKRAVSGCGTVPRSDTRKRAIAAIVREGLWIECEGGWQVHDYPDYQPSRAQVLKRREQQLERWHRWKANQEEGANAPTNAVSDEATNATPDPTRSSTKDVAVALDVGEEQRPRPGENSQEQDPLDENNRAPFGEQALAKLEELKAQATPRSLDEILPPRKRSS